MAAAPGTAPMEALASSYHRILQSGNVLDLLPRSMGGAALEGLCGHLLGCHKADDLLPPPIVGPHVPATGEVSELHNEEFKTDDFRMYSFKVERCTKSQAHDWTECPFAHPGEKAKRRDPRRYKYSGTACPDFRKGTCKRGDACPFAHGVFECHLHPLRYRTHLCKDGPNCTRLVCFFAHSLDELRSQDTPATSASRSPKSEDLSAMSICTGFEECANSLGSFSSRASSVDLSDALHNKGSAAKLIHSAAHSMLSSSVSSTVSMPGQPPAKQGQLPGTDAAAAAQAAAWLNPSPPSQYPSPIDPCLLDMLEGLPGSQQYACALAWPPAAGVPAAPGGAPLAWGPNSSPTLALGNLFAMGAPRASHIAV